MALKSQRMNLDYIRTFVITGQSQSMTDASKKMDVTPSYVSRHIRGLEEELGIKLLTPTPKNMPIKLTETGRFFFERYEKIYNEILITEKEFRQSEQLDNCKITIGVSLDLEENLLKPKLMEYSKKYPKITIKVVNDESEKLANKLSQYAVDFIIDKNVPSNKFKNQTITTNSLYTSNYCYVYNKDYFKDISKLNEIPFILPVSKTQERILIDDYFSSNKIVPNIKYELETPERIISYIKDGFGVGVILKDAIKQYTNLESVDIDIQNNICISYVKEKITPSTKEFLKLFNIEL